MSPVKLYVHAVFGTKKRFPTLEKDKRDLLFTHIKENAKSKNIIIDTINGHDDHVHVLLQLNAVYSLANVMQLIKGESSRWANKEKLFETTLIWATRYFAVSVSFSSLEKVRSYIRNQEEHHKKIGYLEEYLQLIKQANK